MKLIQSGIYRRFLFTGLWLLLMPLPLLKAQESETCLECHGDQSLSEDPDSARLFVDGPVFENSVHGFLSCIECHEDLAGAEPYGHASDLAPVDCAMCHDDVVNEYHESLHYYARDRGNVRAPDCGGCHGTHDILPVSDPASPSHRGNIVDMCASCHSTGGLLTDQLVRLPEAARGYASSVHGQAQRRGIDTAAVCSDCHGAHLLKGVLDPQSKINPINVSATCGQCHNDIRDQYDKSIHGRALRAGIVESPTCNTCHGEHQILSPKDPSAETSAARQAMETCASCHENSRMNAKFGLAGDVVSTYQDSYHGWAKRWDSPTAATCVRCHTAHWVLPERDPASTVSSKNVAETCRQCHPKADQEFSISYTHKTAAPAASPVTQWLEWAYMIIIPAVIGGMILHNLIIFIFYLIRRRRHELEGETISRMDKSQVIQHIVLAISFIILVLTGFALRYQDAFWVIPLKAVGLDENLRSLVHRIAGVALIAVSVYHVAYVFVSRRGRRDLVGMIPRFRDVTDVIGNMGYYLGWRSHRIQFDQYDYAQKAEYWALVWGTLVMAVSGLVLWFPESAVSYFPTWIVQASELLHFYEAWLAMLAIIVWHFFFVIVHPDVYPMSWTWLNGKMNREEALHHHGEWVERLEKEETDKLI